jgi:hypothetical protein
MAEYGYISMKLRNMDESPLMEVFSIEIAGNNLVIKGVILGSMPLACKLTPAEARKGLRLLKGRHILFLLTFLFRNWRD